MSAGKKPIIVLRFGELWLRGKNRGDYINVLIRNIDMKFSA